MVFPVLAWNCNGFASDKADALRLSLPTFGVLPLALALVETHRTLHGSVVEHYVTSPTLQNASLMLSTAPAGAGGAFHGGVALALDATRCVEVASEVS